MGVVAGVAMAEAVDFTAGAVGLLGFTVGAAGVVAGMAVVDLPAFTAEAVGFMDLPSMVARPTSVMGGAVML